MSFFKKLFGGKKSASSGPSATPPPQGPPRPDPPVPDPPTPDGHSGTPTDPYAEPDPGFGHPLSNQARQYARLGDLNGLAAFYEGKRGDEATIIVEAVCKNNDFSGLLEDWGLKASQSATAQLFCGTNFNWRAWEARGGRLASEVSGGQWNLFGTWLDEAQKHLQKAIQLRPGDHEPYHRMIYVLLGKHGATLESQEYLQKVNQIHPNCLMAHLATLTHTLDKWGGSHAAMWKFARDVSARSPEGSPLHALIPAAIIERSVSYMIDKDTEGANDFLQHQDTRDELYQAYLMSSGSNALLDTPLTAVVHNWFACALIYSQLKVGRDALQKVGSQITDRPWAYIRMPVIGHVNELRSDFGYPPI